MRKHIEKPLNIIENTGNKPIVINKTILNKKSSIGVDDTSDNDSQLTEDSIKHQDFREFITSISELPRYADAGTIASDAVTTMPTNGAVVTPQASLAGTGLSTLSIVGLGAMGIGGIAIASSGGSSGNGSTTSTPSDTTAPTFTSGSTATAINENSGANQLIYTASATDASTVTYSLKNTGDYTSLSINSNTGAITLTSNPDYEVKSSYSFTVIATDNNGNASEKEVSLAITDVNETTPIFTSGDTATVAENTSRWNTVYDATADGDSGVTYSFVNGMDEAAFTINSFSGIVTFNTIPDYENPLDSNSDNVYNLTIRATNQQGLFTDKVISLQVTNVNEEGTQTLGEDYIDLGSYGNLIAPIQVNGNWFYYWDRSGDGTNADTGILNGGRDDIIHDVLDALFNQDINGVVNTTVINNDGNFGTTNDYRYAIINGWKVALLTSGTGNTSESSVTTTLQDNQTYTDYAEIWDTYNDESTQIAPTRWYDGYYWSATPSSFDHAYVNLSGGMVYAGNDMSPMSVVLQLVEKVAPSFRSNDSANVEENISTSSMVYDANADGDSGVTYSFGGGIDDALFTMDSSTGIVNFKVSPDYETPLDMGGDNTYNFTVRATDTNGNATDLSVALDVSDQNENYTAGDSVIDLGVYGKLINPVHIDTDNNGIADSWYYAWDINGDGVQNSDSNDSGKYSVDGQILYTSGNGYVFDSLTHDVLDTLFNQDINGNVNNIVQNADGNYGTTNDYRYATLSGVNMALITTGTGNSSETSNTYFEDNQAYTDFAEIWDTFNSGQYTSGVPTNWWPSFYWMATPDSVGHTYGVFSAGYTETYNSLDTQAYYVAVQVL